MTKKISHLLVFFVGLLDRFVAQRDRFINAKRLGF